MKNSPLTSKESLETYKQLKFDIAWYEDALARAKESADLIKKRAQIARRFSTRTFDNFDVSRHEDAYNKCLEYVRTYDTADRNVLILCGNVGTGKTHLACAIANAMLDEGTPVVFSTFGDMLENLKAEFTKNERHYLDDMRLAPMLIIDDIGKERKSDWTESIMYNVLNYRYEAMLPTVMTTNMTIKELGTYLGDACFSRICETAQVIKFDGSDYRKGK